MESLYQAESVLTACLSLVHEPDKPWSSQQPLCINSRKELRRCCSPIGHNNTKHFLCPIRSQHSLDRLEMVRWESVPGAFPPVLKTFVAPFLPAPLTAPGSPRMHWFRLQWWTAVSECSLPLLRIYSLEHVIVQASCWRFKLNFLVLELNFQNVEVIHHRTSQ